jgi:hypothetical protein
MFSKWRGGCWAKIVSGINQSSMIFIGIIVERAATLRENPVLINFR